MSIAAAQKQWRLLGWSLLLLVILAWPIRYIQQKSVGEVVLYTGIVRMSLFTLAFAFAAWAAAGQRSREQFQIMAIGFVLAGVLFYNAVIVDYGVFYTAYGFDLFCLPPALALLFLLNSGYFPPRSERGERRVVHLLLAIAVPIALFGIVQYTLNDPLLQTGFATAARDEFGSVGQAAIRLTQLQATRHIRANSIFGSAIDFGHFDVLFALLCVGMAAKYRRRPAAVLGYLILTGVFVAAVLSTSTRNMLVFLACCAIGCLFILAGFGVRALVALSLALVAVFYGTIYGMIELAPRFFLGFFDVVSLFQRVRGVYSTVEQYIVNADSLTHVLFGFGYMQSIDFKFLPTTVFDNTELDVYLYAGVCGVVLYIVLLVAMFSRAVRQWRETGSVAWLAVASLFVGTPLFSTLNIDLDQPFLLFVFALTVGGWIAPRARAVISRKALADDRLVSQGIA